ncbi:MAG: TIGR04283 family arsenosugar biosynthesis glycosyltransferase [Planctomycetota bacterium]
MLPSDISIVIPTLNEAQTLSASLQSARENDPREIIVCDGGSTDATVEIAHRCGASHVVSSIPGRGIQLNAASTFATGDVILFLHADSLIGPETLHQICDLDAEFVWGAARQKIESSSTVYRVLEFGNNLRVRWCKMAFGDQAIFVKRDAFKRVGGFAEQPLMEDVELSRSLRKLDRPRLIEGPVVTSARRWQRRGVIRQTLLNWKIQLAYKLGMDPETLKGWYG